MSPWFKYGAGGRLGDLRASARRMNAADPLISLGFFVGVHKLQSDWQRRDKAAQGDTDMHALTSRSLSLLSLTAVLTAGAIGCDVDDDAALPRAWWCTQCGAGLGNSPNINGASLANIHLTEPFGDGMYLGPMSSGLNVNLRLGVDANDAFVGLQGDTVVLSGADVVGAKIAVFLSNEEYVWLEITDIDNTVPSWSDSGAMVTAYQATYFDQGVVKSLCPTLVGDDRWFTLIPDERYSSGTNEVESAPGTVTLACVGEAAAKMKLLDFHPRGNRQASPEERQATLRMVTGDYCGNGHSFTVSGTKVAWRDAAGLVEPPFQEYAMEALWDEHGAICLTTPRHAARAEIEAECGEIQPCDGLDFVPRAVWRTMLPK